MDLNLDLLVHLFLFHFLKMKQIFSRLDLIDQPLNPHDFSIHSKTATNFYSHCLGYWIKIKLQWIMKTSRLEISHLADRYKKSKKTKCSI